MNTVSIAELPLNAFAALYALNSIESCTEQTTKDKIHQLIVYETIVTKEARMQSMVKINYGILVGVSVYIFHKINPHCDDRSFPKVTLLAIGFFSFMMVLRASFLERSYKKQSWKITEELIKIGLNNRQ
jgi:hypothetical protein